MLMGIILGFVVPVGLFLYWILILLIISGAHSRNTTSEFKDDV